MQFDEAHSRYPSVTEAYNWFVLADSHWSPDNEIRNQGTVAGRNWYYDNRKLLVDSIFAKMILTETKSPQRIVGTSQRNRRQKRKLQEQSVQTEPIYPEDFVASAVATLEVDGLHWTNTRFYVQPATVWRKGTKYDGEALRMYVNESGQGYLHVFYHAGGYAPMSIGHSHAVLTIGRGGGTSWSVDALTRHHRR